jgi:hypothetical protein
MEQSPEYMPGVLNSWIIYCFVTGGAVLVQQSNAMKEVQQLKKSWEEWCQKQAEQKEENEVLTNKELDNTNWKFLAMIRCVPHNICDRHTPCNYMV